MLARALGDPKRAGLSNPQACGAELGERDVETGRGQVGGPLCPGLAAGPTRDVMDEEFVASGPNAAPSTLGRFRKYGASVGAVQGMREHSLNSLLDVFMYVVAYPAAN